MKYTSKKNLLDLLKPLPYFTKDDVYRLGSNEKNLNLKKETIGVYISRFLKDKDIIALKKRGVYVSADFYNENKNDLSYLFYLANVLYKPSYITSWTALQYYNLATEAIYLIISATTKTTRSYTNKIGNFAYQSIQGELFSDFVLVKSKFDFFIASPAKALFDLLYFRTKQFSGVKFDEILLMVEDLRIDFDLMNKTEQNKFLRITKNYINNKYG